jgi:hypothetical protein
MAPEIPTMEYLLCQTDESPPGQSAGSQGLNSATTYETKIGQYRREVNGKIAATTATWWGTLDHQVQWDEVVAIGEQITPLGLDQQIDPPLG